MRLNLVHFVLKILSHFPHQEWETVEKTLPDGTKKRYRRRIIIVKVVKKPKELVTEDPVACEEVEIDEKNPDDDQYDPNVSNFYFAVLSF